MTDKIEVIAKDTFAFVNEAFRNIIMDRLSPDDLGDIRGALQNLADRHRLAGERAGMERAAGIAEKFAKDAWGMTEENYAFMEVAQAIRAQAGEPT